MLRRNRYRLTTLELRRGETYALLADRHARGRFFHSRFLIQGDWLA